MKILLPLLLLAIFTGCAAEVKRSQTSLQDLPSGLGKEIIIDQNAVIDLGTGYQRILKKNSKWILVGTTIQGNIYKPASGVLTVEGAHVREAYLTLTKDYRLLGFYLPGESAFAELKNQIQLNIK